MFYFDTLFFRAVNGLAGQSAMLDAIGIFLADGLIFFVVGATVILALGSRFGVRRRIAHAGAAALLSAALAIAGNAVFAFLVFRPRPFAALNGVARLIAAPSTDKSFPSDHSSAAFAVAFTLAAQSRAAGAVMIVCAALIAFGRVFAGVHYPSDVIVGAGVGALWAGVVTRWHKNIDRH